MASSCHPPMAWSTPWYSSGQRPSGPGSPALPVACCSPSHPRQCSSVAAVSPLWRWLRGRGQGSMHSWRSPSSEAVKGSELSRESPPACSRSACRGWRLQCSSPPAWAAARHTLVTSPALKRSRLARLEKSPPCSWPPGCFAKAVRARRSGCHRVPPRLTRKGLMLLYEPESGDHRQNRGETDGYFDGGTQQEASQGICNLPSSTSGSQQGGETSRQTRPHCGLSTYHCQRTRLAPTYAAFPSNLRSS